MYLKNNITEEWIPVVAPIITETFPIGGVIEYAGELPPTGWVFVGENVSKTEYPELYSVIGDKYNDETTEEGYFKVYNKKGLTTIGIDLKDEDFNEIGKKVGEKEHTLTSAEIPYHEHLYTNSSGVGVLPTVDMSLGVTWGANFTEGSAYKIAGAQGQKQTTPNGQSHNNIQPSIIGQFICKAKYSISLAGEIINTLEGNETNKAPSIAAINYKIEPVILFEKLDGTVNTFSLNDNWENYKYIEVFYSRAEFQISSEKVPTDIVNENGSLVLGLISSFYGYGTGFWTGWKCLTWKKNSKDCIIKYGNGYVTEKGGQFTTSEENTIRIFKVLGYR